MYDAYYHLHFSTVSALSEDELLYTYENWYKKLKCIIPLTPKIHGVFMAMSLYYSKTKIHVRLFTGVFLNFKDLNSMYLLNIY